MGTFFYRVIGAAVLDGGAYENIEADRRMTIQAALVVVLSSVAAGIGAGGPFGMDARIFMTATGLGLVTWTTWAFLIFYVGTRWLREPQTSVNVGELLRTTGFAASPGLIQVGGVFYGATTFVFVAAWLWMLIAMVVAVKHALDFRSLTRAIAVCVLSAGLVLAFVLGLGILLGPRLS